MRLLNMTARKTKTSILLAFSLLIPGLIPVSSLAGVSATAGDVLEHYAKLARAKYEDALVSARDLQGAVSELVDNPTEDSLAKAKGAWLAARIPYQQSEVYRFGNAIVDDWEGRVNAWPLDEGLLDYVDAGSYGMESEENPGYAANIIGNASISVSGETIDVSEITKELIAKTLQELGGAESNVATGYHAIEFLLWGQDLNGTGPGAGGRPASDFDTAGCTNGNCDRRAAYLQTATDLLVDDLEWIVDQWGADGAATRNVMDSGSKQGLSIIFTGMGSLSYGELAGERMQLGLLLHDPEEEHDCFSDNTHASHYYDALGIQNIYHGTYRRIDGSTLEGPSVSDLVAAASADADAALASALEATMVAMAEIVGAAEAGEAYDQQIGEGNEAGNRRVQAAIDMLKNQTGAIEDAVAVLNLGAIEFEGSDSLDDPEAVFE
ncbi:MAG: peptidase [Gammaproteobacteria bacterium]|nr:peptidase [Gammaproteobacteria bacterium]